MNTETYGVEQLIEDLHVGRCPVHGCDEIFDAKMLMCRGHRRLVHADQKREVYEAVRRLNRIAGRYDASEPGSPRQARLAESYLAEETVFREIQLRAVILASERAGARAEPLHSPTQSTPRKGGSMEIKVRSNEDGGATGWIVDPRSGETVEGSTVDLEPGQEVTFTAVTAHEPTDVTVGEVRTAGEGEAPAPEGEAPSEEAGEAAGEGKADGECPPDGEGETPAE